MEPGLSRDLFAIPFDARRAPTLRMRWHSTKAGLDFVAHNLPRAHHFLVRVNPYPRPWRHVTLQMPDGTRIAGWHAEGKPGAGALLFVPGTFQTKDDTPRKRRALDLWRRFGLHVLVIDLRGFGGSHRAPSSAGYDEAGDVLAAADWLRLRSGAPRVDVWGESLGGAIALLAGCAEGAEESLGRVLAWSPFADLDDATNASSKEHPRGKRMMGRTYRWLLRRRHPTARDFRSYLELRARELDIPLQDLFHATSPAKRAGDLRVPAFVLHAEDDPVVPVSHARRLEALRNEKLAVHIAPRGGHLDFDLVAPAWYRAVTQRMFGSA